MASHDARSRFSSSASKRTMEKNRNGDQRSTLHKLFDCLDIVLHCNCVAKSAVLSIVVLLLSAVDSSLSGKLDVLSLNVIDFGQRNNPINVYFVKASWFWTLVCAVPLSLATGYLLRGMRPAAALPSVGRAALATALWWTLTTLFVRVDGLVGVCSGGGGGEEGEGGTTDRAACYRQGRSWDGFDISGHIFILTYSILLLTEELEPLKVVRSLHSGGSSLAAVASDQPARRRAQEAIGHVHAMSVYFKCACLVFMTAAFTMVVATSLFFHTFTEKLLGLLFGIASWWGSYRFLYHQEVLNWMPSQQL